MPQVDVVVPCYRYGKFLRQSVGSVLDQGVDVRVLIIDDCSPDDSADVGMTLAAADPRVLFRRHSVNAGHIATYNEGIEWASSDCFLLLSADDYLTPGALARGLAVLDRRPDVGFVFGDALELAPDGSQAPMQPLSGRYDHEGDVVFESSQFLRISRASNIVPTPTALVRTRLQKQIGGYRRDLPHSGDMAMWWRFASLGNVGFVDDFQAVYRRHGANMSAQYEVGHRLPDLRQRRDALKYALDHPDCTMGAAFRDEVANILSLDAVSYASQAMNAGDADAAEQLLHFASDEWPRVRRSWPWAKVAMKRAMGTRAWALARRYR